MLSAVREAHNERDEQNYGPSDELLAPLLVGAREAEKQGEQNDTNGHASGDVVAEVALDHVDQVDDPVDQTNRELGRRASDGLWLGDLLANSELHDSRATYQTSDSTTLTILMIL